MTERRTDHRAPVTRFTPPERIGPYRILRVLGEGGMGTVFEAEETGPVRRPVALKVIRAGLDSNEIVARFEAERQALAVMSHPGIAKVLQAGTTDRGQPYFAMELVRGLPITQYCDANRLSVRQRLELFVLVCQAVQHAHQKGVIHRDLKPSNILVGDGDGAPQPKIIDFGIAKALGQKLTERTLVTEHGLAMGTAAYMSPEQADSTGIDVDTRADVYSLGVMLYEMLVGCLPVDPAEVGLNVFLARLVMKESDPPRPSVRLATLRTGEVARSRRTDATHLRRELQGDLDWIVMKAMDLERARRYETASALAADIRHFLADEPVAARPPSAAYRVAKFVRRHRVGVGAGLLVGVAVAGAAVVSSVLLVRATRAEQVAQREAEAARAVTAFLVDIFRLAAPNEDRGRKVTAREILDRGAARAERELAGQPEQQGRMLHTIGSVYGRLGLSDQARALLLQALALRRRTDGPDSLDVAQTLTQLGMVARLRGDSIGADTLLRRALALREAALPAGHKDVGATLSELAVLRLSQSRLADAESLYARVLPIDSTVMATEPARLANNLSGLGAVKVQRGRLAAAESLLTAAIRMQERSLPSDHPDVASTRNILGTVYFFQDRYRDALLTYRQSLDVLERTLGDSHADVGAAHSNIGEAHWKLKEYREAEPRFRRALEIYRAAGLEPGHPYRTATIDSWARMLREQGRAAEAAALTKGLADAPR